MSEKKVFLAADLGAGSGRVMAAEFDGSRIELCEVSRWASEPVKEGDSFHWDIRAIFNEIKNGAKKAREKYGDNIVSLGIDSWAVDYGLLDAQDKLIGNPYIYRDARTNGAMDAVFNLIPKEKIYELTGIQFLFFNTLYQMMAEVKNGERLAKAKTFLMIPDLLSFMFTGVKKNERTNASSTQFYNPFKRNWETSILEKIGANPELFASPFAEAGTYLGEVLPEFQQELGNLKIATVASHDTASAVVSVPTTQANPAYINSGTWALPGMEINSPISTSEALAHNFTNEIGAENTVRFLKNVTGMWLIQKSKEVWAKEGSDKSFEQLRAEAANAKPFESVFDTESPELVMPENMPKAIAEVCKKSGVKVPETHGEIYRAIMESIAKKYAYVFDTLEKLTGIKTDAIHVMGGGSRDDMLNQLTADVTGKTVLAGPVESTALGNVVMQMKASGDISSMAEGRAIVSASCNPKKYTPKA